MTKTLNALKARQNFGELLNEVYYGKETIVIERAGKEMAVIVPLEEYAALKGTQGKTDETLSKARKQLQLALDELTTK